MVRSAYRGGSRLLHGKAQPFDLQRPVLFAKPCIEAGACRWTVTFDLEVGDFRNQRRCLFIRITGNQAMIELLPYPQ